MFEQLVHKMAAGQMWDQAVYWLQQLLNHDVRRSAVGRAKSGVVTGQLRESRGRCRREVVWGWVS
jgi:hypothetical protein